MTFDLSVNCQTCGASVSVPVATDGSFNVDAAMATHVAAVHPPPPPPVMTPLP